MTSIVLTPFDFDKDLSQSVANPKEEVKHQGFLLGVYYYPTINSNGDASKK